MVLQWNSGTMMVEQCKGTKNSNSGTVMVEQCGATMEQWDSDGGTV